MHTEGEGSRESLANREERILNFWKTQEIFQKSLKNREGRTLYSFMTARHLLQVYLIMAIFLPEQLKTLLGVLLLWMDTMFLEDSAGIVMVFL